MISCQLSPHPAHLRANVNWLARRVLVTGGQARRWPRAILKPVQHRLGNETRSLRIDVTVAHAALAVGEETLRHHQVKLVFSPGHGDVKQSALLLDFRVGASGKIGWNAPIDRVEYEDGWTTQQAAREEALLRQLDPEFHEIRHRRHRGQSAANRDPSYCLI